MFMSSLLLLSCGELSQSIKDTVNPNVQNASPEVSDQQPSAGPAVPSAPSGPIAASAEALQRAENSLRNLPQFEGKDIIVFRSVHFYNDGRIMLNIQHPADPSMIDRYTYKNGAWEEPQPVRITKSDRVEDYSASLDKAPFVTAHKVYETIQQKLKEINGDETSGHTVYFVPVNGTIRWYPTRLETDRSRYSLKFDENGNLLSFEQD